MPSAHWNDFLEPSTTLSGERYRPPAVQQHPLCSGNYSRRREGWRLKACIVLRTGSVDPDALEMCYELAEFGAQVYLLSPNPELTQRACTLLALTAKVVQRGGINSERGSKASVRDRLASTRILVDSNLVVSQEPEACLFALTLRKVLQKPTVHIADGVVYKRSIRWPAGGFHAGNFGQACLTRRAWLRLKDLRHVVLRIFTIQAYAASSELDAVALICRSKHATKSNVVVSTYPRFRIHRRFATKQPRYVIFAPTKPAESERYSPGIRQCVEAAFSSSEWKQSLWERNLEFGVREHVKHTKEFVARDSVVDANDGVIFANLCLVLRKAALVVTDYSSVYVDAIVAGVPVLFVGNSLPSNRLRSSAVWPGPRVSTKDDIISEATRLLADKSYFRAERAAALDLLAGEFTSSGFLCDVLNQLGLSEVLQST